MNASRQTKKIVTTGLTALCVLAVTTMAFTPWQIANACSRILYGTAYGSYIVGRTMDWADTSAAIAIWVFPREMKRDGGLGAKPIQWTSKYGSVIVSLYDAGTNEGMNEKGLVVNALYLAETDFGDPAKTGKPTISLGAWAQYFLDNFATVQEAVDAARKEPFTVIPFELYEGKKGTAHLSLSDPAGDSAIFEYINGKLIVHHGRQYAVMTNSPPYDEQLALNAYWDLIGGSKFLPGTIGAADRFVRLSYNLKSSPKYKDPKLAVASVFSQVRAISVPLGMNDPEKPNLAMTLWRSVLDQGSKMYYFETALMPAVMWIDLNKIDFAKGSGVRKIPIDAGTAISGDVSSAFEPAEPFKWVK